MFKSEQLEVWTLSYLLWDYTDLIIWHLGHDYKCIHFKKTKEKHNRSPLKIAWMCCQEFLSWASESTQQEGFSSFQRAKCNWMPVAIDQTFIVSDQFRASFVRRAPSVYTPFIFQADIRLLTNKKQQLTAASVFYTENKENFHQQKGGKGSELCQTVESILILSEMKTGIWLEIFISH